MATYSFEFDRAVLHDLNGSTSTIKNGTVTIGYEPKSFNGTSSVELWYKIPDDSDIYTKVWRTLYLSNSNFTAYSSTRLSSSWYDTVIERSWFTSSNTVVETGTRTKKAHEGETYFSNNISLGIIDSAIAYEEEHDSTNRFIVISISRETNYGGYYDYPGVRIENIQNTVAQVEAYNVSTTIIPVSPIDVAIKKTDPNVFSFGASINRASSLHYIASTKLRITVEGNVHEYTESGTSRSFTVPANDLELGDAVYRIYTYDNNNVASASKEVALIVVGESSAPTITEVTQNAFPTVKWVAAVQDAWQMVVKDADSVLYDSGMVSGTDKQFTLPIMLDDGAYSIEMRILNRYGFYTDWSAYGLALETAKPNAPESIFVSVTNNYGVTIDCEAPADAGTLYVVRRESGSNTAEIIGEYIPGFTDYQIPINKTYEYTIRNYVEGFADGEWIDATIIAKGIVIRDGDDISRAVNVWKVAEGEFELLESNVRDRELVKCVGREFPVAEISEWITSTRSVNVYVDYLAYKDIKNISLNSKKVYLQSSDEYIPCILNIEDTGVYMNSGKFISLVFTRISEE